MFKWLTQKRRLRRLVITAAFVAALAAACMDKSDKFVKLVHRADRNRAVELIKDPQKKDDWKKALVAIQDVNQTLKSSEAHFKKLFKWDMDVDMHSSPVIHHTLWKIFSEELEGKSYRRSIEKKIKSLLDVGLDDTAVDLELKLVRSYEDLDKLVATLFHKELEGTLKRLKSGDKKVIEEMELATRLLKETERKALKAGFVYTAETIARAIKAIKNA